MQAETKDRAYSKANAVAFESFTGLRTVLSLNAAEKMEAKYETATREAKVTGTLNAAKLGLANGSMLGSFNIMYLVITLFSGWALAKQVRETGCDPSGSVPFRIPCNKTFKMGGLTNEMSGTGIFIALMSVAQVSLLLFSSSLWLLTCFSLSLLAGRAVPRKRQQGRGHLCSVQEGHQGGS